MDTVRSKNRRAVFGDFGRQHERWPFDTGFDTASRSKGVFWKRSETQNSIDGENRRVLKR
jgi:hypothetical protein